MRSRPILTTCVTAALAVVAGSLSASAMVVAQRDFADLVARAEQIVVGTVTAVREADDGVGAPATYVTFSELRVVKGDARDTLTLRFYGGTSGSVVVHIPDMPTFAVGERAVLFVAGNGRDVCPLVGVWQGRFRVRFDASRGADVVETNDRVPVLGVAGRKLLRGTRTTDASAAVSLDDFLDVINGELAAPTGAK